MTGSSPAGETAAAADAVLQKPFELDDLLSVVRRLCPQGTMGPPP
jgi:DNA-binding response OmpR family regulator